MMNAEITTPKESVSAIKAVLTGRCPVCREGALFQHSWHHLDFLAAQKHCAACGTDLEPEPGFYYGALYVNYSFNVATLVAVSLFLYVLFAPSSPWVYIGSVIGVTILTIPFTTRLSRMLWMYLFGPYRFDPMWRKLRAHA